MANVSGSLTLSGTITEKTTTGSPVSLGLSATVAETHSYKNGTGAGQIDLLYSVPYTISTLTTIDLTALSDTVNGQTIDSNFARVREFIVINNDATHDLKVSAGASNGWPVLPLSTDTDVLYARANGGKVHIADPQSTGAGVGNVVGASTKTISFDPSSQTISFSLLIAGCSVA